MAMQLVVRLRRCSCDLGADLFGVAGLASAVQAIEAQGGPEVASYPKAISLGIVLLSCKPNRHPQKGGIVESIPISFDAAPLPSALFAQVNLSFAIVHLVL